MQPPARPTPTGAISAPGLTGSPLASRIRVGLVEDDVNFRNSLAGSLEPADDVVLAAVATTRAEGMALLEQAPLDVLLVDLGLPDGSGIDIIRHASETWPRCGIMVCTTFGDESHVLRSIEAGADGYLLKDSDAAAMLEEIRSLHSGGSPISPLIARRILARFRPATPASTASFASLPPPAVAAATDAKTLSARELQTLELITKGFTADEISRLLNVSPHSVLTYIRRIYSKLKVSSRAEAIYEARSKGLLL